MKVGASLLDLLKMIFKKKPKKSNSEMSAEAKEEMYTIISFILAEEKKGNVVMGKRREQIFIGFRNNEAAKFLMDWFSMINLYRNKQLSEDAYKVFISSATAKYVKPVKVGANHTSDTSSENHT